MQADLESPVFPIGVVRRLVGLTERQIRYYDKMGLVTPYRTKGGTRMYSERDIALLRRVKEMMQRGFRVKEVKETFQQERIAAERRLRSAGGRARPGGPASSLESDDERPIVLRSLYPVSDQAVLMKTLDKIRND